MHALQGWRVGHGVSTVSMRRFRDCCDLSWGLKRGKEERRCVQGELRELKNVVM